MIIYDNIGLSDYEEKEIEKLLKIKDLKEDPLNQMWYLLDYIWDVFECDNKKLNLEKINKFYSHPVWLLNGLFVEGHKESIQNREKIVKYLQKNRIKNIIDYGGGFGTLAKLISEEIIDAKVDIYEPYPSEFAIKRIQGCSDINIIKKREKKYECLVQTDVLEHVEDVLLTLEKMIEMIENKGLAIIGNCFYPCIKCHLPMNMHFRYSFDFFAKKMGLIKIDQLGYIGIYKKNEKNYKLSDIKRYIFLSKMYFLIYENLKMLSKKNNFFRFIKNLIKRVIK